MFMNLSTNLLDVNPVLIGEIGLIGIVQRLNDV